MITLKPILNPEDILKDEKSNKFIVAPFGNYFLIGTDSRVMVITMNGVVNKIYFIPQDWAGKDYVLLEYRN